MISDYIQRATRKNRTDITLSVTCYLAAAVCWIYPAFVDGVKYASVLQFSALVFIVAGVFVNQRYSWTNYLYMIRITEDKPYGSVTGCNLAIHKIQGKRSTCIADIPCSGIISLDKCTKKSKVPEAVKKNKDTVRYSFTQTMLPDEFYTAVFYADGGTVAVSFEPDAHLVAMLTECIALREKKEADNTENTNEN